MQMPIPDDWDGESFCRWAVCWPNSIKWKAILYGLLEMPNQGRFWDFKTGEFLALRAQFRNAYDYNFTLQEVIMSCGDTGIAEGLQAIAASLQAMANAQSKASSTASAISSASGGNCCSSTIINSGGGVNGRIDLEGGTSIPRYGTEDPLTIPAGQFPEGYQSRQEYDLDKCQVANVIIDGLVTTLKSLGALTGAETGAALALLIISCVTASIIFPPAAVGIVAAAFGVGTAIFTVLLQVVNYIQEHRSEWVCALYNSNSTDEAITLIAALIATMIAALLIPSAIGAAVTTIILTLLGTDTLNQLFRLQAHLSYPNADCSDCQPVLVWLGTDSGHDYGRDLTQTGPLTWTFRGYQYPDGWQASVYINQGLNGITYYTRLTVNPTPTSWYQAGSSQFNISTPNTVNYQGDGPMTVNLTGNNITVRDNDDDYIATLELSETPF